MLFDAESGTINLEPGLILRRGMTRAEILSIPLTWEDWIVMDGVSYAFRAIIELPNKDMSKKTILIVHVGAGNSAIAFWQLSPWDLLEGKQSRPDGKCTKRMRLWFQEMFSVQVPLGGDWGHIDASYDHWNQTTTVVCNYRERFHGEDEWRRYRQDNRF